MEDVHEKKEFNNEKAECSAHLSDNDAQRGVPIQAASAEPTDPYANETLSDGSGDEAENLEIVQMVRAMRMTPEQLSAMLSGGRIPGMAAHDEQEDTAHEE